MRRSNSVYRRQVMWVHPMVRQFENDLAFGTLNTCEAPFISLLVDGISQNDNLEDQFEQLNSNDRLLNLKLEGATILSNLFSMNQRRKEFCNLAENKSYQNLYVSNCTFYEESERHTVVFKDIINKQKSINKICVLVELSRKNLSFLEYFRQPIKLDSLKSFSLETVSGDILKAKQQEEILKVIFDFIHLQTELESFTLLFKFPLSQLQHNKLLECLSRFKSLKHLSLQFFEGDQAVQNHKILESIPFKSNIISFKLLSRGIDEVNVPFIKEELNSLQCLELDLIPSRHSSTILYFLQYQSNQLRKLMLYFPEDFSEIPSEISSIIANYLLQLSKSSSKQSLSELQIFTHLNENDNKLICTLLLIVPQLKNLEFIEFKTFNINQKQSEMLGELLFSCNKAKIEANQIQKVSKTENSLIVQTTLPFGISYLVRFFEQDTSELDQKIESISIDIQNAQRVDFQNIMKSIARKAPRAQKIFIQESLEIDLLFYFELFPLMKKFNKQSQINEIQSEKTHREKLKWSISYGILMSPLLESLNTPQIGNIKQIVSSRSNNRKRLVKSFQLTKNIKQDRCFRVDIWNEIFQLCNFFE